MNRTEHSQRGAGHIGVIVAIIVVIAVGGIGWWVYQKNKSTKTGLSQEASEAIKNATCNGEDPDICKFYAGWQAQKYYTITTKNEADGKTTTTVMKVDGDNYYMKIDGATPYEIIKIGDATYTKASDGTWWKQTNSAMSAEIDKVRNTADASFTNPDAGTTTEGPKVTYKKLGTEACGDHTCFKYQVVTEGDDTTSYIWFDTKDYQLRRTQITSPNGTYDAMFDYSKVTVNVPSPVKDLGPNQYIIPGQSQPTTLPSTGDGAPSQEQINDLMQQYQ